MYIQVPNPPVGYTLRGGSQAALMMVVPYGRYTGAYGVTYSMYRYRPIHDRTGPMCPAALVDGKVLPALVVHA